VQSTEEIPVVDGRSQPIATCRNQHSCLPEARNARPDFAAAHDTAPQDDLILPA
jgi:hypothetical protein